MADVELESKVVRSTYLLTYSQVNINAFPTRKSFVDMVVEAFPDTATNKLHRIPVTNAVKIEPCGKCFATMAMLGSIYD